MMAILGKGRCVAGLAVIAASALFSPPLLAGPADPYAYKLEITPIEGPLNSEVEHRYTANFESCQKGASTTLQNVACVQAEFTRQDAALNRAWKATLRRIPSAKHKALLAAQRKWIAGRDPFCRSHADSVSLGGTMRPVLYLSCRTELTIRRTIWLEKLH